MLSSRIPAPFCGVEGILLFFSANLKQLPTHPQWVVNQLQQLVDIPGPADSLGRGRLLIAFRGAMAAGDFFNQVFRHAFAALPAPTHWHQDIGAITVVSPSLQTAETALGFASAGSGSPHSFRLSHSRRLCGPALVIANTLWGIYTPRGYSM